MKISLENNEVCGGAFFAKKIALATARAIYREDAGAFLLGCDEKISSKKLCGEIYEGLRLGGAYVYMLGDKELPIASEAEMRYLCGQLEIYGIMITPSHIPGESEMRIFSPNGTELSEESEEKIKRVYLTMPDPFGFIIPADQRIVLCDAEAIYIKALEDV